MRSADAALRTLCDPKTEVSAHYLIAEDGAVTRLVPEALRAWHAGAGRWGEVADVNSRSIGIELSNTGFTPFAAAQMEALGGLLREIFSRWALRPERVIGHSDMAPARKIDPGARFDWQRLARLGLSVWPEPQMVAANKNLRAPDRDQFLRAAQRFGYTASDDPAVILKAVRLRFRPRHTGPLDATDLALIRDLAARFPVDAHLPSA